MSEQDVPLAIVGAGGFAREVLDLARDLERAGGPFRPVAFLTDDPSHHGTEVHGVPVPGGLDWVGSPAAPEGLRVVVAIGATHTRRRVVARLDARGARYATLVHPTAVRSPYVRFGEGTVVCAGNVLTNEVVFGRHVILNLACTVGHDAVLHDFVTVAPGVNISGNVTVGEGVDLGTGGATVQGVTIGAWTVVGAGAVVARDLPPNVTAVGVPAKVIKERPDGWHLA